MRTATQAIAHINAQRTNVPEACQRNTWQAYDANAVGDVDHDGDADAVDGWLSEDPKDRRFSHTPDIGAPVAWSGGSNGFGHRAVCVGYTADGEPLIRSTDVGGRGIMGTVPLSWFKAHWPLLHWLGWSKTISGRKIDGLKPAPVPAPAKETHVTKPTPKPKTRGPKIEHAIKDLKGSKAKPGSVRAKKIRLALDALHDVPFIN